MSARGMRLLGDVAVDVVDKLEQKVFKKASNMAGSADRKDHHRVPNDPRLEWMFRSLLGKDRPEQKILILQAGHPSVGFLMDSDVDVLISALGLGDA